MKELFTANLNFKIKRITKAATEVTGERTEDLSESGNENEGGIFGRRATGRQRVEET